MRLIGASFMYCSLLATACIDTGVSEVRPALGLADRTAACAADPRVVAGAVSGQRPLVRDLPIRSTTTSRSTCRSSRSCRRMIRCSSPNSIRRSPARDPGRAARPRADPRERRRLRAGSDAAADRSHVESQAALVRARALVELAQSTASPAIRLAAILAAREAVELGNSRLGANLSFAIGDGTVMF